MIPQSLPFLPRIHLQPRQPCYLVLRTVTEILVGPDLEEDVVEVEPDIMECTGEPVEEDVEELLVKGRLL